ncbi:MAG: hypothetical protein KF734_04935 [Saprospiraceae bacterium]|nr:hypothetical protein [Saprospiraceae bacterium]
MLRYFTLILSSRFSNLRDFANAGLLLFSPLLLFSQSSGIPLHAPAYHILDRLDIKSGAFGPIHPELKFFPRQDAADYALLLDSLDGSLTWRDRADLQYLFDDNNDCIADTARFCNRNERGLFKVFYRTPANLFEVNTQYFKLRANPMFNFHIGQQQDDPELIFMNQRGLEVRGSVDDKLFFYTNLVESQARFPNYVTKRVEEFNAIPYAGNFKRYNPRVLDVTNAYDFNQATAYISFKATKHVGVQLGHGKHFIGNGYRSLFLADANNYAFYLKLNTRVWRFHYQTLFQELSPIGANDLGNNVRIPKKYVAAHYLNYRITPKLSVGLFEATVFNRSQQFELQYLNPLILYRTVEGMIGSPDNVLVGFDARWNLLDRFQVYGQFVLDEFLFSALVKPEEKGWWGNKYGFQSGVKYINAFGADHLDLQLEYNMVRPFTYSHADSLNAYTHYNQPLAHPLLSNFKEIICMARWQPLPRLIFAARYIHAKTGDNTSTENWGANPMISNQNRVLDYGNFTGQGVAANIDIFGFDASWMMYHNLFVDFKFLYRKKDSADDDRDLKTQIFGLGLRMNLWNANLDF